MRVHLIDYTGAGHPDPNYAAKLLAYVKNTRLEQSVARWEEALTIAPEALLEELKKIAITIRSSWEFIHFTFQLEGISRSFSQQFQRTRTDSYAQQSQRVIDLTGFEARKPARIDNVSRERAWDEAIAAIRGSYNKLTKAGVPAEDARGLLPMSCLGNMLVSCNLRSLADRVGKRQNLRAEDEYKEVITAMVAEVDQVMPWTYMFFYPERTATPALDQILAELKGKASALTNSLLMQAAKELDQLKGIWG